MPIPTYARPRRSTIDQRGEVIDLGPDNRAPMQLKTPPQPSGLDWLRQNGPGRYMGGNAPAAAAQVITTPGEFDTSGIGYDHYHQAFMDRSGGLDPQTKRFMTGHLAGKTEAEARQFTQENWARMKPADRDTMIGKLAPLYGQRRTPAAPNPQELTTAAQLPKPGAQAPAQAQPSAPAAGKAPVGTGTVLKPASALPSTPLPSLPRPPGMDPATAQKGGNVDNALAKRLTGSATINPAGPHVFENGKPVHMAGPKVLTNPAPATAGKPAPPQDDLARRAQALQDAARMLPKPGAGSTASSAPATPRPPIQLKDPATPPMSAEAQAGNERMASGLLNTAAEMKTGKPAPASTVSRIPLPNPEQIAAKLPKPGRRPMPEPLAAR